MTGGLDKVQEILRNPEDVDLPDEIRAQAEIEDHGAPDEPENPAGPDRFDDDPGPDEAAFGGDRGDGEEVDDELRERLRACSVLPLNDIGNGRRFLIHFGGNVLWVPRVGWFSWTGKLWKKDPDEIEVRKCGQQISALIEREIPLLVLSDWHMQKLARKPVVVERMKAIEATRGEDRRLPEDLEQELVELARELATIGSIERTLGDMKKAHRGFAKTSGNTGRIKAAIEEGAVNIARQLEELDRSPLDVNTQSGVLRFAVVQDGGGSVPRPAATVELVPHDRSQLLTKILQTAWDPKATAPKFDAFLRRVQPDPALRGFLQRWFGYAMSGLTGEQKLVFLYGSGANGKSVLVDLMARLFGDYAATAKIESITGKNRRSGAEATPDLVPLIGARLVRASEPEEGERFQEGLIKELTGGEPILIRSLNKDFVEIKPIAKWTISGNHKPDIRGTDDGIWRRFLLVPFDVQIPKAERNPRLVEELLEEGPGILNWLAQGFCDFLEGGLQEPDIVLEATASYRDESDPMGSFLELCCNVTGDAQDRIPARELVQAFNFWLVEKGETAWRDGAVSRKLREKSTRWVSPSTGFKFWHRKSSTMSYDGIRFNFVFADRWAATERDPKTGRPLYRAGATADDTE
jgi:putative DNA primase/helicase